MEENQELVNRIFLIRNQRVMLDSDLAEIYGVETRRLNEQFKRNEMRFPKDFAFRLTAAEWTNLKSQMLVNSTESIDSIIEADDNSSQDWGGRRKMPLVFTEHGAVMLASILSSEKAVEASIFVVRTFIRFRHMISTQDHLAMKILQLEEKFDGQFNIVFDALRDLLEHPPLPKIRQRIGFKKDEVG